MIRECLYVLALTLSMLWPLAPEKVTAAEPQTSPKVWSCYKAAVPTSWTGQTSYVATTPTLIIRKAAGATRTSFRRLDISQNGVVAGALINVVIKLDTVDRYSAAGNLWLIRAKDFATPAATQPTFTIYDTATATAEAATVRTLFEGTIFQTVTGLGTGFIYDFPAEDVLGATGSLLIYLYAGTTGPTFNGTITVYE